MRITSITAENKPHAHHESHLHTIKVVKIQFIPSFHGLRYERLGARPRFCVLNTKKKKKLADYYSRNYATSSKRN